MTKRITRAVTPEDLPDLLARPPRANVAFVREGVVQASPAAFLFRDGRYWIGAGADGPQPGDAVSLVIDDGRYYNELRGFRVQGRIAEGGETPQGAPHVPEWFEVIPDKAVAWHYGRMRQRPRGTTAGCGRGRNDTP